MPVYRQVLTIAAVVLGVGRSFAQTPDPPQLTPRNLLTSRYEFASVASLLVDHGQWNPLPSISDRAAWDAVPPQVREAHITAAESLLASPWESMPATLFLEFARTGNRSNYERVSFGRRERLALVVIAELLEDRGRFLDEIVDGVWMISEETFWGVPAHLDLQTAGFGLPDASEPAVDLFAAETGALLAWTLYLLDDRLDSVSPLVRDRIRSEIRRRILEPLRSRDDFWWMGFDPTVINNWTPWVASNWLPSLLIVETDTDERAFGVHKIMRTLDTFLNSYPDDGGCDEGPAYWNRAGGSLLDALEILGLASQEDISIYHEPLVQDMARFIYRTHAGGPFFINFADAAPRVVPDPAVMLTFGKRIGDDRLQRFAGFVARQEGLGSGVVRERFGSIFRQIRRLLAIPELLAIDASQPLLGDVWLPDLQVMAARQMEGSTSGFYLAAKAGHNGENHNHNDVGNFIVYEAGRPVLIDVGPGTYTRTTFSSDRYSVWNFQSAFHNVPTVNGFMQRDGRTFAASDVKYSRGEGRSELRLQLAGAYPDSACVESWTRTVALDRYANEVTVDESYRLSAFRHAPRLNLMTSLVPEVAGPGVVRLVQTGQRDVLLTFDSEGVQVEVESIVLEDPRLRREWGEMLYRIVLAAEKKDLSGRLTLTIRRSAEE